VARPGSILLVPDDKQLIIVKQALAALVWMQEYNVGHAGAPMASALMVNRSGFPLGAAASSVFLNLMS